MATTKTDSRSQTARARARQAMADELERSRQREAKLVSVFSAIDAREEVEATLGRALVELRDLGVAQSELAGMTGLTAREVGAAIRSAKDGSVTAEGESTSDVSEEDQDSSSTVTNHDGSATPVPEHAHH